VSDLRIAQGFKIPLDVAGEAIAILAKRGAGKTNTATVLVEEMHAAGVQLVILDPVGAWWGIRYGADGKGAGLPVPILGGQHGDVPLEPTAGALIADVLVDSGESLLLDLSDFPSKAAIARFAVDFAERLYRRKARSPSLLHVVLEEADSFAPQRGGADDARMRGAIESIVRRGRSRGIGITMVTQRSAVLNKDVLSQADVMIAMRTTSPHDKKAIELWVEAHDDENRDVVESLSGLKTGEAWVWNPERTLLDRVQIRRRKTFDSSATPKAGERRAQPKTAASIDLSALGEQMKATAERVKAEDPKALRAKVRELEKKLRARPAETETKVETVVERVEVPVLKPGNKLETVLLPVLEKLPRLLTEATDELRQLLEATTTNGKGATHGADRHRTRGAEPPARRDRKEAQAHQREARRDPGAEEADADFTPSGPQRRILDALAALEAIGVPQASKTQLALFSEASPKSSAYTNNLGALRTAGLIDYPSPGRAHLTEAGRDLADAGAAPSTVDELHDFVFRLVGPAKTRLLRELIIAYERGETLDKQGLAARAGASATSSAFTNNLGSLRSLGLIDYPGPGLVEAKPVLFLEDAAVY
jgi:hypothetical protein